MKIVSRQTLQNLIRHQLLEHYTKKINLLTENITLSKDDLKNSLDQILPDDSRNIFNENKSEWTISGHHSATASELGHARTCLVLICLYELLNNTEINTILEKNNIIIADTTKTTFTNIIKDFFNFFSEDLVKNKKDAFTYVSFRNVIKGVKNQVLSSLNLIPDFIKFLLKQPNVLLGQLTIDKVFDAWPVAWPNNDNTVALITNPFWEGELTYQGWVKPKIEDPLKEALDTLIPQFKAEIGDSSSADSEKSKEGKDSKKENNENAQKISDLKKSIQNSSNISDTKILTQSDVDAVKKLGEQGKSLGEDEELKKNVKYNTETLVTQLFVYYMLLNAAEHTASGKAIYEIGKVRDIIQAIDKTAGNNSNFTRDSSPLDKLSKKEIGLNIYSEIYNIFGDEKLLATETKQKLAGGLQKLLNNGIITKINNINIDNPLFNNIKLFLNQIDVDGFKEIRDAIFNSTTFRNSFDYYDIDHNCATRLHNSDRVVEVVSTILLNKLPKFLNSFSGKKADIQKQKEELEKLEKIDSSKQEVQPKKTNKLKSPTDKLTDEEWTKVIQKIEELKKKKPNERTTEEIDTVKKILKNLQTKGVDTQEVKDALKDLEEMKSAENNNDTASAEDDTASSESNEDDTASNEDSEKESEQSNTSPVNELENIFRVPQLNGGYGQLAQILTSSNLLKNYKSGNFKRGKYDKADSYGYIFMDDETMDKAANLYSAAIKTLSRKISLSPVVEKKIEAELKDYKKIGSYLNEYFNKKMLLANEYLLIDGSVILYLALRVLENLGLEGEKFQQLHQDIVVNKDPVVIPHNIKITNLDDAIAKKVDLNKRISIDQMFQNRKAKNTSTQKTEVSPSQTNTSQEKPTPIEDEDILATKSLKRVKALITQLGGKMFKQDIEEDDLITRAANGKYSKGQLGREIVQIADTVYQRANDFDFNEFEKKQLKLGLQNYFEQKLSNYNGTDDLITVINQKINQF